AGNEGVNSYESVYRPTLVEPLGPGGGFAHNFSGPGTTPRYFQPIYIPPNGGVLIASFQWDQSSKSASGVGCASDYDIYLSDLNGNIVAAGATDNIMSGDPIEVFGYQNFDPVNYTFFLTIVKYAGPDASRLKYVMYNDAQFFLTTNPIPGILSPSLVGHPKAEGAIATGAAWYLQTPAYGVDTAVIDYYSSKGGVANYYDIHGNRIPPQILKKPEIVAPDGGNTSFFDPFGDGDITQDTDTFPNFFGTSAAAPHAAGVAALMIEAQKLRTITPAQIKGILSTHTSDMDDPDTQGFDKGFDFATGNGLIRADAAVGEVKFPNSFIKNLSLKPVCSDNPSVTRNWEIDNPNPFDMEVSWFAVGSTQHDKLTVPPGATTFSTNTDYFRRAPIGSILILDWDDNYGFSRFDLASSTNAKCGKGKLSTDDGDKSFNGEGLTFSATTGKPNVAEVYPNPSTNAFRLYMSLDGQQKANIELFSIDGKRLQAKTVAQSNGVIDIDASGYRPGLYILKVTQGGFVKTMKVIKQ
ncbi:MAG TPA: S8 family peptidase, partial [Puia sp.]|nr:S8 family peptidase [Puia sp.]